MILLPNNKDNWVARVMDIEMLTFLNAKERTKSEYIQLLKESGYEFKELYRTDGPYSIIEAITMTDILD
ncbi:unnamed protein product [Rotaria sp. Silwood2]|nr:unnamed protein product [Rotaria sp. Silwood2]